MFLHPLTIRRSFHLLSSPSSAEGCCWNGEHWAHHHLSSAAFGYLAVSPHWRTFAFWFSCSICVSQESPLTYNSNLLGLRGYLWEVLKCKTDASFWNSKSDASFFVLSVVAQEFGKEEWTIQFQSACFFWARALWAIFSECNSLTVCNEPLLGALIIFWDFTLKNNGIMAS